MSSVATHFDESVKGSGFLDASLMDWQSSELPGFEIVTLFENSVTGESTSIMKVAPGAYAGMHTHDMLEEIYILEGEFSDQYRTYTKGQYCIREAGEPHTSASKEGCLVFLVYRLKQDVTR
jgi:anti-sigma factor ChrR (cupin superfamily)